MRCSAHPADQFLCSRKMPGELAKVSVFYLSAFCSCVNDCKSLASDENIIIRLSKHKSFAYLKMFSLH